MTTQILKSSTILILVAAFGLSAPLNAQGDKDRRYDIKSAIIKYKIQGMVEGEETWYIDDYGANEARYSNAVIKMFGEQESEELTIIKGRDEYKIDLKKRTGTKEPVEFFVKIENSDKPIDKTLPPFEQFAQAEGMKKVGTGEVLGKKADIWEVEGKTKIYLWNGIPLKIDAYMGEQILLKMEALEIQDGADIPATKLEIPADITFE